MKIVYRPEIDGLRAIAVVSVILYHAKINVLGQNLFDGGFIGVDIFFVISGYLITSIILKELITTGSFSFKNFYERRVRRILPVLLIVMLASIQFAWMYLLPSSFIDFSKSILYSLGFSSNFYFHYSGQEYEDISGLLKPFLHTWSLSVEEQFYLLFPVALLIIFKNLRKYLVHILIITLLISLFFTDWGSKNYPSASFYFPHTRLWELLAGSILAYFEILLGHRSKEKILNVLFPKIGLLLIVTTIIFFKLYFPHPSLHTLPAILGVCLIIWFSDKDEIVTKILSSKLFVGIGLISYSLYLWHYPIFAFARTTEFYQRADLLENLFLGILIYVLSIFSYYLIEKPARNKKNRFKIILNTILIATFVLIIANLSIIFNEGYKNRVPEILQKVSLKDPWNLLRNSKNQICYNNKSLCDFNTSSDKKIYLVGDSHAASIMYDIKDRIIKKKYQFITSTFSGCLYFPGFNLVNTKTDKIDENCNNRYFQKLKETLLKEKNSILVFGGRYQLYFSDYNLFDNQEGGLEGEQWGNSYISNGEYKTIQNSFKDEILELSNNNKIILVYPLPEVGWDPKQKILSQWIINKSLKDSEFKNINTSYQVFNNRTKSSFELLDSIKGDNIYRVYPHKLFCNTLITNRCITHDGKNIFYADSNHPSLKGAEMINNLIIKEIIKIELKSK